MITARIAMARSTSRRVKPPWSAWHIAARRMVRAGLALYAIDLLIALQLHHLLPFAFLPEHRPPYLGDPDIFQRLQLRDRFLPRIVPEILLGKGPFVLFFKYGPGACGHQVLIHLARCQERRSGNAVRKTHILHAPVLHADERNE